MVFFVHLKYINLISYLLGLMNIIKTKKLLFYIIWIQARKFLGFIDADGSFYINIRERSKEDKKRYRVDTRITLEQRINDPVTGDSYYTVLNKIAETFQVQLKTSKHNDNIQYFIITVTSPVKQIILINYLDKHPLYSSKYLNYLNFKKCVFLKLEKKHLT